MRRSLACVALGVAAVVSACSTPETRSDVRGVYNGPSATQGAVSVSHERIPGVMEAMTMDFAVADTAGLGRLKAGDKVRFQLDGDVRASGFARLPDTTRLVLAPAMTERL